MSDLSGASTPTTSTKSSTPMYKYRGYKTGGEGGVTNDIKSLRLELSKISDNLKKREEEGTLSTDEMRQAEDTIKHLTEKIQDLTGGASKFNTGLGMLSAALSGDVRGVTESLEKHGVISEASSKKADLIYSGIETFSNILGGVADVMLAASSQFDSAIQEGVSNFAKYTGKINARLYGLQDETEGLTNYFGDEEDGFAAHVTAALSDNSYIYQVDVLENIAKLVEQGVGYNLESRAYLATLTEKTVTTFNALDPVLLRSIRLYGMDITAPMMGAESLLTNTLNSLFKDSSYLSSMYDSVYNAIYDANSQLTSSESVTWSLAVQSWLGALYSVGISDNTITTLAQGLNYLGTGDVTALSGNQALQTILAMAAANSGLSYGDILLNGLDVETTDKLMQAIIDQLQDISANTSTEVVKKAWTEVLGISISDLSAINRLSTSDISAISALATGTSYADTISELERQVEEYLVSDARTTLSERIQNTMDNMMYSVGSTIANSSTLYQDWAKAKFAIEITSSLPFDIFDLGKNIAKLISAAEIEDVIQKAINTVYQAQTGVPLSPAALEAAKDEYPELWAAWEAYKLSAEGLLVGAGYGEKYQYKAFLQSQGDTTAADLSGTSVWGYLKKYYATVFNENGADNRASLWAFFSDAYNNGGTVTNRGEEENTQNDATAEEEKKETSFSVKTSSSTKSSSDSSIDYFDIASEDNTVTVEGTEPESTYDISDLYELLTDETKYIRVKLVDVNDDTVIKLGLDELRSYLINANNTDFSKTIQNMRSN